MIALTLPAQEGGTFTPPGVSSHLPAIFSIGSFDFTKQMLLVLLSVVLIAWFFIAAGRKGQLVPGRLQFAGEMGYNFVRNSVAKDVIGGKDFVKYVPLLFTLFFFILVNNIYGAIPILQLPSFSHVGGTYLLAIVVYVIWISAGVRRNGVKFFKMAVVPSGVPWPILPLVVPIEIISNFVVRPMTHSLRLFATMLSGHLIVLIAGSGIEFLLAQEGFLLKGTSLLVLIGAVAMYMLEALIMVLQAYVFTLLTAIYIEGAIHADSH
ncbi:F0F1 ATP synthase subunit A [Paenarthrobacter sp. Z7-10]|uniref:F0F1 ATP synthase subunit A n=1 Tax=Paenarthrobacter sp. Z7-10 TaxID=2787635 RepID=UPI0022A97951|nr:F0F1 ATP synthase subunit A [Paenarthrobacter sp. Z7-10]MCZ2402412.1 F0F1 ATP synthase subunit A [Paenarthrobacter sp. Z7-10]